MCLEISPNGTRYAAGSHLVCLCVYVCVFVTHSVYHSWLPLSSSAPLPPLHPYNTAHLKYPPRTHTLRGTMNDSLTCRLLCMLPLKHLYSLTHEISFECCSPPHCSPLITIHQFSIACISMFPKLLFTTTADIQRNNFTYVFQLWGLNVMR